MRHSIVFRASRAALFVSAMMVIASVAFAQSDPMAKWKPSVGSSFSYDRVFESWDVWPPDPSIHDTVTFVIVSNNHFYDSTRPSVVVATVGIDSLFYYFHPSSDTTGSTHSFVIQTNYSGLEYLPDNPSYDFQASHDSTILFGTQKLTLYAASHGFYYWGGINDSGGSGMSYSPELHWFYSVNGLYYHRHGGYQWLYTLVSAQVIKSSVPSVAVKNSTSAANWANSLSPDGGMIIFEVSPYIEGKAEIELLDPLARPIRSWSLDVAAGESQVHLNVADVPSGVYFLKLSAPGVEEVRKVMIVH